MIYRTPMLQLKRAGIFRDDEGRSWACEREMREAFGVKGGCARLAFTMEEGEPPDEAVEVDARVWYGIQYRYKGEPIFRSIFEGLDTFLYCTLFEGFEDGPNTYKVWVWAEEGDEG